MTKQQIDRVRRGGGSRRGVILTAAVASTLGLAGATTHAANIQWNVADGNWADAANWNPNTAVPVETDVAILDFVGGGIARVNTDLVNDVLTLKVQNGNTLSVETGGILRAIIGSSNPVVNDALQAVRVGDGSAGTLSISGDGSFANTFTTASANQSADIYIGVGAGGVGTLNMGGTTSTLGARDLRIGSDGATATATFSGGTTSANFFILGRVGGSGTASLTGGTITTTGEINIGAGGGGLDGTGTLTQSGGLLTNTSTLSIGRGGTSTGTARGIGTYTLETGGTVDVNFTPATTTNGHFVIGMNGGKGTMTMNGGSVTTDSGFYVGFNDGGAVNNRSEGTFDLNGGTISVGGIFAVGIAAATGTMTMDGGTINVTGVGGVGYDDRGNTGRATLTFGTLDHLAGTINTSGGFFVGRGGGNGTYNLGGTAILNAGTGTTGDLVVGGPGDNATAVSVREGKLNISGIAAANVAGGLRLGEDRGKGFITMTGGTLTVAGNSIIGQSGTAAKPGTGSLILNGATASASIGGTLSVADASNTTGSVTVTQGNLNVTGNALIGGGGTGNANLTVNGGTATFAGNLTSGDSQNSTGVINVSAGTLNVGGALVAGRQTTVSGVITVSGTGVVNAGSVGVRTGTGSVAATDFNVTGGTLNVTNNVANNSTFDYTGGAANIGGAITGTGTTSVAAGLNLAADSVAQGAVNVDGKITVRPDSTATGVSKINTITLGAAGKIDLTDNKLITPSPLGTWNGSAYTDLAGLVDLGRGDDANGKWDGARGIVTSDTRAAGVANAGNNDLVSIGTATAAEVKGIASTDTATFAGQTVLGSDSIAMVTWGGDANLDGKINILDYGQIDFNVGSSGSVFGWYNGDFNYDGKINILDYGIIDFNVSAQDSVFASAGGAGGGIDGVAAVPEPASLGLIGLGAVSLLRRRRRAH